MNKAFLAILLLAAVSALAQEGLTDKQKANREIVNKWNKERLEKFQGKDHILVLPSLIADKKEKKITILAEATNIGDKDLVEFFMIGPESGHDYEALTITFARPADIKKALEFIGMTAGHPINPRKNLFWPEGERVNVKVAPFGKPDKLIPIQRYVLDDRTGKTLPEVGFIFTGSVMIEDMNGEKVLAVDVREPQSIISNYNEPETLLDIPYRGNQDELYDHLHAHADIKLPDFEMLEVTIEPEYKDGTKRVCKLTLEVSPPEEVSASITNQAFTVTDSGGKLLNSDPSLKSAIDIFNAKNKDNKDVYVSLVISHSMPIQEASHVCKLLETLEESEAIRIDAPPEGQLYYRAFNPSRAHLDRKARSGHPWELRLKKTDKGTVGTLTLCEFDWDNTDKATGNPTIKATDYEVDSPGALRAQIKDVNDIREKHDKQPVIPVVLLVAPPDMLFGEVMAFVKPAMDLVPVIHIYAGEKASAEEAQAASE